MVTESEDEMLHPQVSPGPRCPQGEPYLTSQLFYYILQTLLLNCWMYTWPWVAPRSHQARRRRSQEAEET